MSHAFSLCDVVLVLWTICAVEENMLFIRFVLAGKRSRPMPMLQKASSQCLCISPAAIPPSSAFKAFIQTEMFIKNHLDVVLCGPLRPTIGSVHYWH